MPRRSPSRLPPCCRCYIAGSCPAGLDIGGFQVGRATGRTVIAAIAADTSGPSSEDATASTPGGRVASGCTSRASAGSGVAGGGADPRATASGADDADHAEQVMSHQAPGRPRRDPGRYGAPAPDPRGDQQPVPDDRRGTARTANSSSSPARAPLDRDPARRSAAPFYHIDVTAGTRHARRRAGRGGRTSEARSVFAGQAGMLMLLVYGIDANGLRITRNGAPRRGRPDPHVLAEQLARAPWPLEKRSGRHAATRIGQDPADGTSERRSAGSG